MDTGTSMEATAAAHHSGPIEPAARTPPLPFAAAPRARITSFFSGSSLPTVTGTGTVTPAVAQPPTTGTITGEAQKTLAEAPNTSATGPETPAAAPESPATTKPPRYHTPSSGRVCSHSIATDVPLSPALNMTPSRYHAPSCGAPVHGAYHRGYARYYTPL